jgi:hypothetical protein
MADHMRFGAILFIKLLKLLIIIIYIPLVNYTIEYAIINYDDRI